MEENSIMEALGLEGEREQEAAEPAAEETAEGAPAAETAQEETEAAPAESPVQSPEERSRQAWGRRQRETEAAVNAARAEERAKVDALLKSLGIKNPNSGETVDTLDALEKYERALSAQRVASGKPSEGDIRRIIREEMQPKVQQPSREDVQAIVEKQLAEIRRIDPDVKSLDDILKSEVGGAFRRYVAENPGRSFVDAYNAVAQSRIAARKQAAAEQTAINRINSKSHLSATAMRGQGSTPVPRDQLAIFRALMPDVPDADFERFYNRKEK